MACLWVIKLSGGINMFQKFYTNTIESKFIKNILNSVWLPTLKTVRDGDLIIEGCQYIYKNNIIECSQTGPVFGPESRYLTTLEDLLVDSELVLSTAVIPGEYKVIDTFVFGSRYKNFTYQYKSAHDYYDSDTHYQLGQYLRCLRDLQGLDLMPYYNCFNYKTTSGFSIGKKGIDEPNEKRKQVAIPVKFNKKYTIALTCKYLTRLKAVLYNSTGLIKSAYQGVTTDLTGLLNDSVCLVSNSQFNQPFIWEVSCEDKYLQSFENCLYLIIDLPVDTRTSIVVLEGDFTTLRGDKTFDVSEIERIPTDEINQLLIASPSLLAFDDGEIYAFSDKLIENLSLNVINKNDEIVQNTQRVENYAQLQSDIAVKQNSMCFIRNYDSSNTLDGVWNKYLRYVLFKSYMSSSDRVYNDIFDVDGFVDKKMEEFLTKGLGV